MGSSVSAEGFDWDAQLLADKTVYAKEVSADYDTKEATPPIRRSDAVDGLKARYWGASTLWELFQQGVTKYPDGLCFGTRAFVQEEKEIKRGEYKWLTFKQASERATNIGKGLVALGYGVGDNIGIFSINRAEWVLTCLGAYSQRMRGVALYDTLGEKAIEYIANHAELKVVFCSKDTLPKLVKELGHCKAVKLIVQFDVSEDYGNFMDTIDEKQKSAAEAQGVQVIGLSDVIAKGAAAEGGPNPAEADDLALIMYTSGTTGDPKGVMLSHRNIVAATSGLPGVDFGKGDYYISFLPLAHIFETVTQAFCWSQGVAIGFFQGNVKFIMDDFNALQPTLLCGVPRVFERMYSRVFDKVKDNSCLLKFVFHKAYADQANAVRQGTRIASWDARVFSKIKATLGMTRIKAVATGGAPCPPYLFEFLKIIFGCAILQGYGLTETSAALCVSYGNDKTIGSVGPPNCSFEIRLKSVPEMGYLVTDNPPRGEIQCRGDGVFRGYYKNEEATRDTMEGEWFATGDVGRLNPNGSICIIDRKKNIFKLSHGEYVAVEKVENVYKQCSLITQIWVYGNSFKSLLVAVVVPAAETIRKIAQEEGLWTAKASFGTPEYCSEFKKAFETNRAKFTKMIFEDLQKFEGPLKGFEKVKAIYCEVNFDLLGNGFTVEDDTMTPTFKLRRPQLLKKYLEPVQAMYADLGEPAKAEERWVK